NFTRANALRMPFPQLVGSAGRLPPLRRRAVSASDPTTTHRAKADTHCLNNLLELKSDHRNKHVAQEVRRVHFAHERLCSTCLHFSQVYHSLHTRFISGIRPRRHSSYMLLAAAALPLAQGVRIVQSNDDGWSEINLRTFFNVLNTAGHQVVLSGPAENQSGRGSSDAPPKTVDSDGCIHASCPGGSPAIGSNTTDPRLNYVNSFPVTAIKQGIDVTGPKLWNGAKPELALAGPNVGSNVAVQVPFSGTVGAATYAAHTAKIPAIAFSGVSGDPAGWNTPTPLYSRVYADLALNITTTIINSGKPYLPDNTFLNVNFPAVSDTRCNKASDFEYIFTRINTGLLSSRDADWCGSTRLPWEADVIVLRGSSCYVSISPGDASDKTTVNDAAVQNQIINKLKPILSCL
ncbi:hypothetical protein J1614_010036, partial [Plenodomus biglobosus]